MEAPWSFPASRSPWRKKRWPTRWRRLDSLRGVPGVDPARVYLVGHSLGGYLAPRIAARDGKLAGVVVLAGNTRPLEDLIVEQLDYLAANAPSERPDRGGAARSDARAGGEDQGAHAG